MFESIITKLCNARFGARTKSYAAGGAEGPGKAGFPQGALSFEYKPRTVKLQGCGTTCKGASSKAGMPNFVSISPGVNNARVKTYLKKSVFVLAWSFAGVDDQLKMPKWFGSDVNKRFSNHRCEYLIV